MLDKQIEFRFLKFQLNVQSDAKFSEVKLINCVRERKREITQVLLGEKYD